MLQDARFLFLSFEGRIGRFEFWGGLAVVLAAALLVQALVAWFYGASGEPPLGHVLLSFPFYFALLWPLAALGAKRFHDRGRPGWLGLVARGPPYLQTIAETFHFTETSEGATGLGLALSVITLACLLGAIIELGFLAGEEDANRFGPPPDQSDARPGGEA